MELTITQALAKINVLKKRIENKAAFVREHVARQKMYEDPFAAEGGTPKEIVSAQDSIRKNSESVIKLRCAINASNTLTYVEAAHLRRSIAAWLIWKREVEPSERTRVAALLEAIKRTRETAASKKVQVVSHDGEAQEPLDLMINIDEKALRLKASLLDDITGELDGELSQSNATTTINVEL